MCEPMNPAPPVTRYRTPAAEGRNWTTRVGAFLAASEASRASCARPRLSSSDHSCRPDAAPSSSRRERQGMNDLLLRVRRTPDRLLHPYRRRKALESLRGRPRPTPLLALCHGNICRSPLAAALLARELAALGVEVQSAGFLGLNRPPPAEAIAAAERHQVNLSDHRSRLVTVDLVRAADLIVVMDPTQRRPVFERFG